VIPARAPGVVVAELGDDVVVHDRAGGRFHVLDQTSALVWQCFDGIATVDEICADIVEVFASDDAEVRAYVVALVSLLSERGLIVDAAARPGAATDAPGPVPHASASLGPAAAPA
jgi:Coenzyme PQQ synthesis protein D (PqqD)